MGFKKRTARKAPRKRVTLPEGCDEIVPIPKGFEGIVTLLSYEASQKIYDELAKQWLQSKELKAFVSFLGERLDQRDKQGGEE